MNSQSAESYVGKLRVERFEFLGRFSELSIGLCDVTFQLPNALLKTLNLLAVLPIHNLNSDHSAVTVECG